MPLSVLLAGSIRAWPNWVLLMWPHFLGITRIVLNLADRHINLLCTVSLNSRRYLYCTPLCFTMTPLHPLYTLSLHHIHRATTISSLSQAFLPPPTHTSLIYHLPLTSHPFKWGSSQMIMLVFIVLLSASSAHAILSAILHMELRNLCHHHLTSGTEMTPLFRHRIMV